MMPVIRLIVLLIALVAAIGLYVQAQPIEPNLVQIDPVVEVHNLLDTGELAEAARMVAFLVSFPEFSDNAELLSLQAEIESERRNIFYQAKEMFRGAILGESQEPVGLTATVIADFLVIGDFRDLAVQGVRYFKDEPVDPVVSSLAGIGLVATTAQVLSGGSTVASGGLASPTLLASSGGKVMISFLKQARRLGRLPPWLKQQLSDLPRMKQSKIRNLQGSLLDPIVILAKTDGGLTLLSKTTDAKSLGRMARFADTFGSDAGSVYRLGGNAAVVSLQSGRFSPEIIRQASVYGQTGLRFLDRHGALSFAKFTARGTKTLYKGDLTKLLSTWLPTIPSWWLWMLVSLAGIVLLPWKMAPSYRP